MVKYGAIYPRQSIADMTALCPNEISQRQKGEKHISGMKIMKIMITGIDHSGDNSVVQGVLTPEAL